MSSSRSLPEKQSVTHRITGRLVLEGWVWKQEKGQGSCRHPDSDQEEHLATSMNRRRKVREMAESLLRIINSCQAWGEAHFSARTWRLSQKVKM